MRSKSCLAEVYLNKISRVHPLEVCTLEPFYSAHEINRNFFLEEVYKLSLDFWVLQEVEKIINIDTESEGGC